MSSRSAFCSSGPRTHGEGHLPSVHANPDGRPRAIRALNANAWRASLLILGAAVLAGCSGPNDHEPLAPRTVLVHTVAASSESGTYYSGRLRAADRTDLGFEVSGPVALVNVELGDEVAAGQELAVLDDRPLRLDLDARRADLQSAIATRDEARLDLERHLRLLDTGAVARSEIDRARARAESEEARVESLVAAVGRAREALEDTRIVAPYDGEIVERMVEPGEQVSAGRTALRMVGVDAPLEAQAFVPSWVRSELRVGTAVQVRAVQTHPGSLDRDLVGGELVEIGAESNAAGQFPVTVRLDADRAGPFVGSMRPGESVEVAFIDDRAIALVIPLTSFVSTGVNQARVLTVTGTGDGATVRERAIELGTYRTSQVEVVNGLTPGERIVARGVEFLKDGDPIRPVDQVAERYNQ